MAKRKAATKAEARKSPTTPKGREIVFRGDRLKALREARGMSQVELAVAARVQPMKVSNVERGTSDPQLASFKRLCLALDADPRYLLGISDKP